MVLIIHSIYTTILIMVLSALTDKPQIATIITNTISIADYTHNVLYPPPPDQYSGA